MDKQVELINYFNEINYELNLLAHDIALDDYLLKINTFKGQRYSVEVINFEDKFNNGLFNNTSLLNKVYEEYIRIKGDNFIYDLKDLLEKNINLTNNYLYLKELNNYLNINYKETNILKRSK